MKNCGLPLLAFIIAYASVSASSSARAEVVVVVDAETGEGIPGCRDGRGGSTRWDGCLDVPGADDTLVLSHPAYRQSSLAASTPAVAVLEPLPNTGFLHVRFGTLAGSGFGFRTLFIRSVGGNTFVDIHGEDCVDQVRVRLPAGRYSAFATRDGMVNAYVSAPEPPYTRRPNPPFVISENATTTVDMVFVRKATLRGQVVGASEVELVVIDLRVRAGERIRAQVHDGRFSVAIPPSRVRIQIVSPAVTKPGEQLGAIVVDLEPGSEFLHDFGEAVN